MVLERSVLPSAGVCSFAHVHVANGFYITLPAYKHLLDGYSWVTQVQFYKIDANKNMGQNISLRHR